MKFDFLHEIFNVPKSLNKEQSEYLKAYGFKEGLPNGTTEKQLIQGIKYDTDKARFDLIPADAIEEVAKIYALGAKKYGDRNWERGLEYGRLFRALMNHSWSWWKGERDDRENKLHHLTSVIFNALALLHYELNSEKFSKFDDRNK